MMMVIDIQPMVVPIQRFPSDGRSYYGGVYQRNDVPSEQWPAMMPTSNHLKGETIPPHDESRLTASE